MKKVFTLICLSAFLLPALAWAHEGTEQAHHGPNSAVRKYIKEQIMPVLIQKRQAFDRELSASEKTEIAECRVALKQLHGENHGWNKESENAQNSDNKYYGQKHDPNSSFEQRKAIMERLKAIAEKHSNSLTDIKTQLEPARKQWVSDIKRLMPAANSTDQKAAEGNQQNHHHHGGFGELLNPHHMAARFLLLPATAEANTTISNQPGAVNGGTALPAANEMTTNFTSFQLMPNPASTDLQLGNDVLPANNILKVIDLQGKEVLTLENVQAAQHLDISQLANGTYLVQIKSGDQSISNKVVIAH